MLPYHCTDKQRGMCFEEKDAEKKKSMQSLWSRADVAYAKSLIICSLYLYTLMRIYKLVLNTHVVYR